MKIARLTIVNFRGIKNAEIYFDGHTLLVGMNNVGKSTICEALDLVLGPDRINRFPPVDEFDFYNSEYYNSDTQVATPIRIEVILTDISEDIAQSCGQHIEFWHIEERRLLTSNEIDLANSPITMPCLRLESIAKYNPDEDEFEANTYFSHSPNSTDEEELKKVSKRTKQLFGFLYLRTLRTGSRALSLERGSLLDIILRLQGIRTGLWEQSIKRLKELDPPIDHDAVNLRPVLDSIEERLAQYIPSPGGNNATRLFVSQLTREHLRKTISFFLSMSSDQEPVPFQEVGTGTLNILVLALLSFIAEIKKDNVIFAMEEPEIALPPHTQRRIAKYLLEKTTQCFVTSHSPYILECFHPDQIMILRRETDATLTATELTVGESLKGKTFRRHARRGLAEGMLGNGVIVAEGITEKDVLITVAAKLEEVDDSLMPLDLSGVTIFDVNGDGAMPDFGSFFKEIGIKTYAFYDYKPRKPEDIQKFNDAFDYPNETKYPKIEELLIAETPVDVQWKFLEIVRGESTVNKYGIPASRPTQDTIHKKAREVLDANKGDRMAARLLELCEVADLPVSVTDFLKKIYEDFPKPPKVSLPLVTTVLGNTSPIANTA